METVVDNIMISRQKKMYDKRKSLGLCPRCGEQSNTRIYCDICTQKLSEARTKYMQNGGRVKKQQRQKLQYKTLIEQSLCVDCRKPSLTLRCNSCHDKNLQSCSKWAASKKGYNNRRRSEFRAKKREYEQLYFNDPKNRIAKNLRIRLSIAVRKNQKTGSAVRDLGCTIPELKTYLESKFAPGMSWDNYGEWHIDHIKPLCQFNLSEESELKAACHYTNLQPLWASDNLSKGGT